MLAFGLDPVWHRAAGNREDGHDRDLGTCGGGERFRDALAFETEVEGAERGDTEGEAALLDGHEHASADHLRHGVDERV